MRKVAFIFPGQGSQTVGMGKDLYERYAIVRDTFNEADKALEFSITGLCFDGPGEELKKTANTQPAILTVSVALTRLLNEHGIRPDIVAGHSLGEYSALVAADALDFSDAVRLVRKRGQYMQEAVPLGEGAMAAVMGLNREAIIEICKKISLDFGIVQPVNFNCPGQVVIAGKTAAVEKAAELLKEAGAKRVLPLPVSAPFHSSLLEPAAQKLAGEFRKIKLRNPKVPVVANVNGEIITNGEIMQELLIRQAASPVLWEDCVAKIVEFGATVLVEVGPGKVLTGFTKKIAPDATALNVEDVASFEKTLDYFQEVR